jgi:phospholipase/carboxylesterase
MPETLLPAIVIEPRGIHRSTILWLHGLGANGYDFEPVAAELRLPESLGVRFVLPHAPPRPVTINGGYVMPAWYDIAAPDLSLIPDERGIQASRQAVMKLVEKEIAEGVAPEGIVLAGFSQGGVIALETATQHQDRVGGAIALSCYTALPHALPEAIRPFPVFMGHGIQDPVVPCALGLAGRNLLEAKGYSVEWHSYPMPHSVCRDEIQDIRNWLMRKLAVGEE